MLAACLDYLEPSDILVVPSLCSAVPLPGGRLVCRIFAALAEFIRKLIVKGTLAQAYVLDPPGSGLTLRRAPACCRRARLTVAGVLRGTSCLGQTNPG